MTSDSREKVNVATNLARMDRRLFLGTAFGLLAATAGSPALAAPADYASNAITSNALTSNQVAGTVDWHPCPQYSDEVLEAMLRPQEISAFRKQWARTECGKVTVPLDYKNPDGRKISIAITRLPATDRAHRKGSIAFNPGGPGGSGYLMPTLVTIIRPENATLNKQYDLIGFDPRGIGYSSKVRCANLADEPRPEGTGPVTKADAKRAHEEIARSNAECANSQKAFLSQVTTPNIARDLDRVRSTLGDRKLNYYGGSWGTWLGAIYRSEFPRQAGRFFLDSNMPRTFAMDKLIADGAKAAARDFKRLARWIAEHNDVYNFGSSGAEVERALAALSRSYDERPRKFTDLPDSFDGFVIANIASQPSLSWPMAAKLLQELRDAKGPAAPPTFKRMFGGEAGPPPPDGAPQQFNPTMARATMCNEDSGGRDFETWWDAYQEGLKKYPVTGRFTMYVPMCAGWPLPVQKPKLTNPHTPLVLAGHLWENVTPYEWTWELQSAVGGRVFTVGDDLHGAVLDAPACAAMLHDYFATGKKPTYCPGVPVPASTDIDLPGEEPLHTTLLPTDPNDILHGVANGGLNDVLARVWRT